MTQSYFITGTDTGVGKTYVACKLIKQYIAQGFKVVAMKPVAAGCELVDGVWVNEDVKLLTEASNVKVPADLINPYCFKEPIAPHIAAQHEGVIISLEVIESAYHQLTQMADIVIVEGAGGLLVPLDSELTIADLIARLNIPTILVVGLKLGCINHTLLTMEVSASRNLPITMWVANSLGEEMQACVENTHTLATKLSSLKQLVL
jgi:dethiobiotin synthetase